MKRFIAATVAALSLFTATAHAAVDQVRGLVMGDKSVTLVIPVAEAFKDGQLTPEARVQIRSVVDFGLTFNMRLSVTLPARLQWPTWKKCSKRARRWLSTRPAMMRCWSFTP